MTSFTTHPPVQVQSLSLWAYFVQCFSINYVNFKGRARRKEYWGFQLFNYLVSMVGLLLWFVLVGPQTSSEQSSREAPKHIWLAFMWGAYFVAVFLPALAVTVRRLHDLGITGWLVLINIIPYLGGIILFIITVLPGTKGPNSFGPSPKETEASEVAEVFN
jgi:uncharacterized membrane protein YhaH (DUF805 family)